jgi:hypothetical protein
MKVKKYTCLVAAVIISMYAVVLSQGYPNIDALTRPSDDSANILLLGIKSVWVDTLIHSNVRSYKGGLSSIDLDDSVIKQLSKAGVVVTSDAAYDARFLVDIQLAKRKETEFVAANISVSFTERVPLERIPPRFKGFLLWGTTWQSRKTLILHNNEISKEVPKCLRSMVGHFCRVFHESKHGFPFPPPEKSEEK